MKLNPYNKQIEEEKVHQFLEVCCPNECQEENQKTTADKVFEEMTEQMYFNERRKKNMISYFQMVEVLLKQFSRVKTVNTTNLELSYTNENSSFNDFLFQEQLNAMMVRPEGGVEEMEVTFDVHQEEEDQIGQKHQKLQFESERDLQEYLPNYESKESELQLASHPNQFQSSFESLFYRELHRKFKSVHSSFSNLAQTSTEGLQSVKILDTLFQAVAKGDKKRWMELMRQRQVDGARQSQELHFIEKLQKQYSQIKTSNIFSNELIRKMLTAPFLREQVIREAGLSFEIV